MKKCLVVNLDSNTTKKEIEKVLNSPSENCYCIVPTKHFGNLMIFSNVNAYTIRKFNVLNKLGKVDNYMCTNNSEDIRGKRLKSMNVFGRDVSLNFAKIKRRGLNQTFIPLNRG